MQGFPSTWWRASLWHPVFGPDNIYLTGDALHRLGQNSAVEYYTARNKGNVHHAESKSTQTHFWVMRAQATDTVTAANAIVSIPLAEEMVHLLLLGGTDLQTALQNGQVLQTNKLSTTNLELLFHYHCVVIQGQLPSTYFRRCYARGPNGGRKICTCANFAQRGNCAHIWYIAALQGEIDLAAVPSKAKPGRKRCQAVSQCFRPRSDEGSQEAAARMKRTRSKNDSSCFEQTFAARSVALLPSWRIFTACHTSSICTTSFFTPGLCTRLSYNCKSCIGKSCVASLFCFQRHNVDLRCETLGALYLPLQRRFLQDFAQDHGCVTCARFPLLAFDGKVNRAVPVCMQKNGHTLPSHGTWGCTFGLWLRGAPSSGFLRVCIAPHRGRHIQDQAGMLSGAQTEAWPMVCFASF